MTAKSHVRRSYGLGVNTPAVCKPLIRLTQLPNAIFHYLSLHLPLWMCVECQSRNDSAHHNMFAPSTKWLVPSSQQACIAVKVKHLQKVWLASSFLPRRVVLVNAERYCIFLWHVALVVELYKSSVLHSLSLQHLAYRLRSV